MDKQSIQLDPEMVNKSVGHFEKAVEMLERKDMGYFDREAWLKIPLKERVEAMKFRLSQIEKMTQSEFVGGEV